MGGGKDNENRGPPVPSGELARLDLTRPSLKLLVKVRSVQYLHLVQNAGNAWSSKTDYLQPWALFGEPLTERDAAELVTQMPEILDSLHPRLTKQVQQGVLDFVKRNWGKMRQYLGPSPSSEAGTEAPMREEEADSFLNSTALVDLLSLKDVSEISVNLSSAVRTAFTMHPGRAEMLWRVRSAHRAGAHPLYLSANFAKHVNSYAKDYPDATVSVSACLYTLMEGTEDGDGRTAGGGSPLAGLEGIPWINDDKTGGEYTFLYELRHGSAQRRARAVWIAVSSYEHEASPQQLSGNKDSLEPFLETLLMGPRVGETDAGAGKRAVRGLLPRANSKTAVADE